MLNTATATGDEIKDPKSDEPKEPNGGDEVETPTFAPITLKPKDVTATYNGAAITGKDVEITSGKLLEGHKMCIRDRFSRRIHPRTARARSSSPSRSERPC